MVVSETIFEMITYKKTPIFPDRYLPVRKSYSQLFPIARPKHIGFWKPIQRTERECLSSILPRSLGSRSITSPELWRTNEKKGGVQMNPLKKIIGVGFYHAKRRKNNQKNPWHTAYAFHLFDIFDHPFNTQDQHPILLTRPTHVLTDTTTTITTTMGGGGCSSSSSSNSVAVRFDERFWGPSPSDTTTFSFYDDDDDKKKKNQNINDNIYDAALFGQEIYGP